MGIFSRLSLHIILLCKMKVYETEAKHKMYSKIHFTAERNKNIAESQSLLVIRQSNPLIIRK